MSLLLARVEPAANDRTGLGPFSRLALAGVSQRRYGSFDKSGVTPVNVVDTLSVSISDVAELTALAAVTDTLTVALTDSATAQAVIADALRGRGRNRKTLRLRGRRISDDDPPAAGVEIPPTQSGPTAIPVALRATARPVEPLAKYVRKAQDDAYAVEREIAALMAKAMRAEQDEEDEIFMLLDLLD